MDVKKIKIISCLLYSIIQICFMGCRQDVYDPNNKDSNINEPITLDYYNSFTFMINANDITYYVVENTNLEEPLARINIGIESYQSGYVEIFVTNNQLVSLYSKKLETNTQNLSATLKGYSPERLAINFHNFTGNLKIVLNSSL